MPRDRNPDATESSHDVGYRPPVVRTPSRPRRSTLTFAALGALAATVALAGSADPSRPAAAAPADDGADAVRALDFATVAQPGVACTHAVDGATPRVIGVAGGESAVLDATTFARLTVDPTVLYADLDGDGTDEAVVRATCDYGANGAEDTVQVWSANGRLATLVDTVTAAPEAVADESRFPPGVVDVAVDDGSLEITFSVHADDDPNCCPSEQAVVTYTLDGGLEVDGRPQVEPADG